MKCLRYLPLSSSLWSQIRAAPPCCSSVPTFCVFQALRKTGKPECPATWARMAACNFLSLYLLRLWVLLDKLCACVSIVISPIGWVIHNKVLVSTKLCSERKAAGCISEGEAECPVKKTGAPAPHLPSGFRVPRDSLKQRPTGASKALRTELDLLISWSLRRSFLQKGHLTVESSNLRSSHHLEDISHPLT